MEICPFVYGRALKPSEFYNRHEELRRLLGRVVTGQAAALIGQPHSGKTSFLNYLMDTRSRRTIIGDKLDRSIFSYIDSQMLGHDFVQTDFWKQALIPLIRQFVIQQTNRQALEVQLHEPLSGSYEKEQIRKKLEHGQIEPTSIYQAYRTTESNQFGTFTLEQLFQIVGREGWQFVLLIDEFDALLTHPTLNKTEFYGGLRSLASRCSGFTLVIASRHSLELLNLETQKINPHGSPYFNIFTEFRLGPLPEVHSNAVLDQARGRFGSLDRAFIARVSGLHPYLLQTAAAILWDLHEQNIEGTERYHTAADEMYQQTLSHFNDTWNAWSRAERKVITSIALVQINGMVGEHSFAWQKFLGKITDYSAELRKLTDTGTIMKTDEQTWKLSQEAFLWWWADKIKLIIREKSDFEGWLCAQEMDGLFTKEERQKMSETAQNISASLGKGANTLIETFAKGLGSGAVNAFGGS